MATDVNMSDCPDTDELVPMIDCPVTDESIVGLHIRQCPSCQRKVARLKRAQDRDVDTAARGPVASIDHSDDDIESDSANGRTSEPWKVPPLVTQVRLPQFNDSHLSTDFLHPPQKPDEIGRLGSFRMLSLAGGGAMGLVFKAEDTVLNRIVAVKVMKPILSVHDIGPSRFMREARAAASINHENVVRIFQVGEDRGLPFIAMEYLEGESLASRIRREKRLPMIDALRIAREVAAGLSAAHKLGLIHRDVKPSNIILEQIDETTRADWPSFASSIHSAVSRSTGSLSTDAVSAELQLDSLPAVATRAKIVDFGLSRAMEVESELTQSGHVAGTPQYMSPEQIDGLALQSSSDLFSLGCVLYLMMTGELPFVGSTMTSVMRAIVDRPHTPLRERIPDVTQGVEDLINQLLAKNPSERPQTAWEVVQQIHGLELSLAGLQAPTMAVSNRRDVPSRKRTITIICATVIFACAAIFVAALYSPQQQAKTLPSQTTTETSPNPSPAPSTEPQKTEPVAIVETGDRSVIAWALRRGVRQLQIRSNGELKMIKGNEDLPVGPLELVQISAESIIKPWEDEDVEQLRGLQNLKVIWLDYSHITDDALDILESLPVLQSLCLNYSRITDRSVSNLSRMRGLKSLAIAGQPITNEALTSFVKLPIIGFLGLDNTFVTSEGIRQLQPVLTLQSFSFDNHQLTAEMVDVLANRRRTVNLQIHFRDEEPPASLAGLKSLNDLEIAHGERLPTDLGFLRELPSLTALSIHHCPLTDRHLHAIASCSHLKTLTIDKTQVSQDAIRKLKIDHPNWEIKFNGNAVQP